MASTTKSGSLSKKPPTHPPRSYETQNAQVSLFLERQRAFTKREMNGHILNVHHGLNQLESYLYGDGELHQTALETKPSQDWKIVVQELILQGKATEVLRSGDEAMSEQRLLGYLLTRFADAPTDHRAALEKLLDWFDTATNLMNLPTVTHRQLAEVESEAARVVNWEQTPLLALRESVRDLCEALGNQMARLATELAGFLVRAEGIVVADSEGGMKAKQARISLQLQLQAFQKLVDAVEHSRRLLDDPDVAQIERSEETAQYKIYYHHERKLNRLLHERLAEVEAALANKTAQLEKAEAELESCIHEMDSEISFLKSDLADKELEISDLQDQMTNQKSQMEDILQGISRLQQEKEQLEMERNTLQADNLGLKQAAEDTALLRNFQTVKSRMQDLGALVEEQQEIREKRNELESSGSSQAASLTASLRSHLQEHEDLMTRESSVAMQMKIASEAALQEIGQSCQAFIKDTIETAHKRIADVRSTLSEMAGRLDGSAHEDAELKELMEQIDCFQHKDPFEALRKSAEDGDELGASGLISEPSGTLSSHGDYVKSFDKFKKCLSTRRRCMVTADSAEDYCSQVSAIVVDFMFKFPELEERNLLMQEFVNALEKEEMTVLKTVLSEAEAAECGSDSVRESEDEGSLSTETASVGPTQALAHIPATEQDTEDFETEAPDEEDAEEEAFENGSLAPEELLESAHNRDAATQTMSTPASVEEKGLTSADKERYNAEIESMRALLSEHKNTIEEKDREICALRRLQSQIETRSREETRDIPEPPKDAPSRKSDDEICDQDAKRAAPAYRADGIPFSPTAAPQNSNTRVGASVSAEVHHDRPSEQPVLNQTTSERSAITPQDTAHSSPSNPSPDETTEEQSVPQTEADSLEETVKKEASEQERLEVKLNAARVSKVQEADTAEPSSPHDIPSGPLRTYSSLSDSILASAVLSEALDELKDINLDDTEETPLQPLPQRTDLFQDFEFLEDSMSSLDATLTTAASAASPERRVAFTDGTIAEDTPILTQESVDADQTAGMDHQEVVELRSELQAAFSCYNEMLTAARKCDQLSSEGPLEEHHIQNLQAAAQQAKLDLAHLFSPRRPDTSPLEHQKTIDGLLQEYIFADLTVMESASRPKCTSSAVGETKHLKAMTHTAHDVETRSTNALSKTPLETLESPFLPTVAATLSRAPIC